MGKFKELAINELNEVQYRVTTMGEFRFKDEGEATSFKKRFLDFIQHEKDIYILEQDLDVSMISKEFKTSYGSANEVLRNRSIVRV